MRITTIIYKIKKETGMRKYFILFILGTILYGCMPSKELTQDQREQIFEHKVNFKQDEIKKRLILFVNETFRSGKAVTQNNEDGIFTGNGIVTLKNTQGIFGLGSNGIKTELTFIVKYSDNGYRVKWVVKDIMNDKGSFASGIWGYYSEEIDATIKSNDKEMFEYINNNSSDF